MTFSSQNTPKNCYKSCGKRLQDAGLCDCHNRVVAFGSQKTKTMENTFWKKFAEEKPHCYRTGDWDGKKSDELLIADAQGLFYTGVCYQGIMDGVEFCEFYDNRDFEIENVTHFAEMPEVL